MYVLAASLEAATLRDSHTQVFVRISGLVIDGDFVVQVRSGGAPAGADVADGVATMNLLPGGDRQAGKGAAAGGEPVAVIQHDGLAISAKEVGEDDYAVGRSNHCVAVRAANINPAMKCALSVERIDALSEASCDLAFNRPEVGRGVRPEPVRRGGVTGHAQADADRGSATERGVAQNAQLIERRTDVSVLDFLLRCRNQRRLRFQPVER